MLTKVAIINVLLIYLFCPGKSSPNLLRQKRFVKYPKGSAVGYIVAYLLPTYCCLAIPTEDISKNVYVAFNFEANFILPNYEDGSSSNLSKRSTDTKGSNNLEEIVDAYSSIKETFTRRNIYGTLESQLFLFGMNGTACILKTICQTAEVPINESNGIFGSLFHIIFTPSSSSDEALPNQVYEAENNGRTNQCDVYESDCPKSILDLVTHTITE